MDSSLEVTSVYEATWTFTQEPGACHDNKTSRLLPVSFMGHVGEGGAGRDIF